MVILVYKDHFKTAIGAPVVQGLALTKNEHGGGQSIGHGTVIAYDGDGGESVVDGIAAFGIYEVMVGLIVLGEGTLVSATCDNCGFAYRDNTKIGRSVVGVLHSYVPVGAVGLEAKSLDIAARGHDAACDAYVSHSVYCVFCGVTLANGGKAELCPGGERNRIGAGAGEAGEHHAVKAAHAKVACKLFGGGDIVTSVVEAPALQHREDGEIQCAVGLAVNYVCGAEHFRNLTGDGYVGAVCIVDGVGGAGFDIGVQHGIHGEDNAFRGAQTGFCFGAVCDKTHDCVHGKNLPLALFRLAACGERQHCA